MFRKCANDNGTNIKFQWLERFLPGKQQMAREQHSSSLLPHWWKSCCRQPDLKLKETYWACARFAHKGAHSAPWSKSRTRIWHPHSTKWNTKFWNNACFQWSTEMWNRWHRKVWHVPNCLGTNTFGGHTPATSWIKTTKGMVGRQHWVASKYWRMQHLNWFVLRPCYECIEFAQIEHVTFWAFADSTVKRMHFACCSYIGLGIAIFRTFATQAPQSKRRINVIKIDPVLLCNGTAPWMKR